MRGKTTKRIHCPRIRVRSSVRPDHVPFSAWGLLCHQSLAGTTYFSSCDYHRCHRLSHMEKQSKMVKDGL